MSGIPKNAELLRDMGELDASSLPAGLLKDHSLKPDVWGRLEVLSGSLRFVWAAESSVDQSLKAGDVVIIPPTELHHLETSGEFRLRLALYMLAAPS